MPRLRAPARQPAGGVRRHSGGQLSLPPPLPAPPDPVPRACRPPPPESADKAAGRSPLAPAPGNPGLTHLFFAAGIPGRRPRVRLRPRSAPARAPPPARARPPALLRCPAATAPRPGSARRPWARAPRATAAGAGSFSPAAAALRPLPPDVKQGGGGSAEAGGGTRRPAPRGAVTRRDPHASPLPVRWLGPPPLPVPCGPAPCSHDLRHRAGRWDRGGTPGPGKGNRTYPVFPKGPLRPTARAGRPGSGMGLRRSLRYGYRNEGRRATSRRVSEASLRGGPEWSYLDPQFCIVSWLDA